MIRNHQIHSHFGSNEFYLYYKKNGGKLSRREFGKVLKSINLKLAAKILEGYSFKMPARMGILTITRKKEFVGFKEGRAITNRPIDYYSTNKLWAENPEAKKQGKLVRFLNKHTNGYIYKVAYNKYYANYKNKAVFSLQVNRAIKRQLARNIFNGFQLDEKIRLR